MKALLVILAMGFLLSCTSPVVQKDPSNEKATLELTFHDDSRTLLPNYSSLVSDYQIALASVSGDYTREETFPNGISISLDEVPVGLLNVRVNAFNDQGDLILTGSEQTNIAGGTNTANILLEGLLSGLGGLSLDLAFDNKSDVSAIEYSLVDLQAPADFQILPFSSSNAILLVENLPAGSYVLQIRFKNPDDVILARIFEVVWIRGNITTEASLSVLGGEFGVPPTIGEGIVLEYRDNSVIVNIEDESNVESGFILQRSLDGLLWSQIALMSPNQTQFVDTNVAGNNTYHYRVWSYNDFGKSPIQSAQISIPEIEPKAQTPSISPPGGVMELGQILTLTSITEGAAIHYTMDGTTPTTESPLYSTNLVLDQEGEFLIKAVAVAPGYRSSDIAEASFSVIVSRGITVYAKQSHIWAWYDGVNYTQSGEWPGDIMSESGSWYTASFPEQNALNIIFSNNGSAQTEDLSRTTGTWWYFENAWYSGNPEDAVPPQVNLISPMSGWSGGGMLTLEATATDNMGVIRVDFLVDDVLIGSDTTSPYTFQWDTTDFSNGDHTLTAQAWDGAGNDDQETITVSSTNTGIPPVANAGDDILILAGSDAVFNASSSFDPNGSIVSYSWSNGLTGINPILTYPDITETLVTLTVTDDEGLSDTDTVLVQVVETIPWRDFREENVYFMMTDRFADGDLNNNNIWGDEYLPGGEGDKYVYSEDKTGVLSYYHGGDFRGIINNLDYLEEMGFTAIWITPVVKQPEGRYFYDGSNGGDAYSASAFHGYWAYDFDQIDPHLHSSGTENDGWNDFKELADALHAREMKLMLDIVTNHGHPGAPTAPTQWLDVADTVIMDGQTWSWATDPYHDEEDIATGFFNHQGGYSLVDLLDFNERGPEGLDAREHLKNVYKRFIDAGVDAFRIDTVAYMTNEWWGEFADAMYDYAKTKGNDYFYMVGESWTGRGTAIERHSLDTTDSFHMLDMQLSTMDYPGQMHAVFKDGGDYSLFETVVAQDEIQGLDSESATWTGMFVDNHDVFRSNGIFTQQQYMNALTYIYLFRGIPYVFYGTEAMYSWSGAHATTNKDDVVSRWMLGQVGIDYVKNNQPPMYLHLKMLNHLRLSSERIQKGIQENILLSGDRAIFKRTHEGVSAFVAISKGASYSYSFENIPDGTYRLLTPGTGGNFSQSSVTVSGGSFTVEVPAHGFVILD